MSASALGIKARGHEEDGMEPGDTPRYGAGANIENHPQVTDYVPRRYRLIALYLLAAAGLAILGEVLVIKATSLAEWTQVLAADYISTEIAGGLFAWTSATVLLVAACYSRLILSLRRHRVDDSRGRYRIWRWASWAAVALSLNAVVGGHAVVAPVLGHFTGWSLLPGNVLWWLVPAAVCGGWLMLRMILEARECRVTLACYLLAAASLVVAGIACVWSPAWAMDYQQTLYRLLPVIANVLIMTGTLVFARYVVLDVQGLIEHQVPARPTSPKLSIASEEQQKDVSPTADLDSQPDYEQADSPEESWVDGSEPEDEFDEQPSRRLSKAERKRLRKQKQRRRAA